MITKVGKLLISYLMLNIVGRLNWTGLKYFFQGREFDLTDEDIETACDYLLADRYIGLGWRKTHFTSYLIAIGHFILTGRWTLWSHAWANIDDETKDPFRMRIYESVAVGAKISRFWNVLNVDAVALLRPKHLSAEQWEKVNTAIVSAISRKTKYDIFANEEDHSEVNCVELVVMAILEAAPDALPGTSAMMKKTKALTPPMLYESGDFDIVWEVRR